MVWRAKEWAERNRSAFCDGYTLRAGADPREQATLLRAFDLVKAVQDIALEARRPGSSQANRYAVVERYLTDQLRNGS
jgi:maltokinase